MNEIAYLPVTELKRRLDAGDLTATVLMDNYLARIERYDGKLHSFVTVYAEQARAAAAAADAARDAGQEIGPLHGIPIALKDIIDLRGKVTTGGSKAWDKRVSPVTATLATRLMAAGMIIIGKTHTVEFAMGGWGTNQHMGTPWNPWDATTHRAPGGSSAGSGVAVAAGLAPWAIGTDTGGSVRLPSAWCGLTGLKTTIGRVSTYGVLPLSTTLDTPGPMCRSVEDAATLFDVLQGPDPMDPRTLVSAPSEPFARLKAGVRGLRLARLPANERNAVDAEIIAAYDQALDVLASLGADIVDVTLPRTMDSLGTMVGNIIGAEGYALVGDRVDDMTLPIDEAVRPRIWLGKEMSAREYYLTLREAQAIREEFDDALLEVDALVIPTATTPAPPVDAIDQSKSPAGFTRIVNLLERCALTQPNGLTKGGLPCALQTICAHNDEAMALRIGWAFEQATKWHADTPPEFA